MKLKSLIIVVLLTLLYTTNLNAQSHSSTSSRKWKGIDLQEWYEHHNDGDTAHVYLYNVGTGRFVIDGGDWGMEGRLFYDDFGRRVLLKIETENGEKALKIEPGITENNTAEKRLFTCNIPTVTKNVTWKKSKTEMSVTTIMDGYYQLGRWRFESVETDPNSDSYTYYLYQQHSSNTAYNKAFTKSYQGIDIKNIKFWLGAAYGEYCSDGTETFSNGEKNNKGCGYYVNVDDDRSCWTSAGSPNNEELSPKGNQTPVKVNGDDVTIDELYQWRIISEAEFITVLNEEVIGINPSISSLVPDRDFTRNSDKFFGFWDVTPAASTTPAEGEGRYGYTWGYINNSARQEPHNDEAWDAPVRLKKLFGNNNEKNKIKIAKYGFMSFEGIGTVHATFELPHPGWYQVDAAALNFSTDPSHFGYMYAQAGYVSEATWTDDNDLGNPRLGYSRVKLIQKTDIDGLIQEYEADGIFKDVKDYLPTSNSKNNEYSNIAVGCVLTRKNEEIRHKLWIYVDPEQFNQGGDNKKLTIGFGKQNAKKKKGGVNNQKTYYYDEDWLCVDDIRVTYMGLAPAFFYEEEENLNYLIFDEVHIDDRPSAVPDGKYSGALCLERKMTKNEWNSFSFPIPLTGEQMRLAFGNDAELLELDSVYNNEAGKPYLINFKTVDLKQPVTDINAIPMIVEPGKFYLLKPTLDPVTGEDPMKRTTEYYELGRNFFAASSEGKPAQLPSDYKYTEIDTDHPYVRNELSSKDGNNDGFSYVSYVRTRGMYNPDGTRKNPSEFLTNGVYDASKIDNLQDRINPVTEYLFVPKGGYAIANKDGKRVFMEVNKDTPIKGFRGWLTLAHSIFTTDDEANEIKVTVNNSLDDDEIITSIDGYELKPQKIMNGTDVYDLSGRKVGQFGETSLQRGIYIVAGKKIFVK
jgi:hypothetical protein